MLSITNETEQQFYALVGRRIRHLRWISGVSQSDLAEALGVSVALLRACEAGLTRPSADLLLAIARAQSMPIAFYVAAPESAWDQSAGMSKLH